jgi:uncharacterized protein
METRIHTFIDLDQPSSGRGYLRVPYSGNDSAYGWLGVPAFVLAGARPGPRVLLLGGVHGDEYEGQVALARLARRLGEASVHGTLLVLPSTHAPAAYAGKRLSPVDGVNLNRAFPGDANGSPGQMLAHYLEEVLLPGCDAVIDLHSGGGSLEYLPCVRARLSADPQVRRRTVELVRSFGTGFGVLFRPSRAEPRTLSAACERKNVPYINPETWGGGRIGLAAMQATEEGLLRCLALLGVVPQEAAPAPREDLRFATLGPDSLVYSEHDGIWEPRVALGTEVRPGTLLALVHDLKRPWHEPAPVHASAAGTVLCQRATAPVAVGDCLFEIGIPSAPEA